jgi:hypothetical protein
VLQFKGKVDLIYIDPPFDAGTDFTWDVPIGDERETVAKDQSTLELVAYRDMWGKESCSETIVRQNTNKIASFKVYLEHASNRGTALPRNRCWPHSIWGTTDRNAYFILPDSAVA